MVAVDWETFATIYYSTPVILIQLAVCVLLWRLTRDTRTWGLLIVGSFLSIFARFFIVQGIMPVWLDDVFRAVSITVNTLGFLSLYFLLKNLIQKDDKKRKG